MMKAIVLAAGQGTRLRPHTNEKPKCMVALAGRPILHRQLDTLKQAGVDDVTVVGGYKADKLQASDVQVVINPLYDRTNMVATLFCAAEAMVPGEDLLISYGDIVFERRVLSAVLDSDAEIALAADEDWRRLWASRMDDPLSDAETFKMTDDKRVIELGKKPESYDDAQAQYMGLIRVRADRVAAFKEAYEAMDRDATYDGKDFDNMYMTSFMQYLIDNDWDVRACLVRNGWVEVDTAEELEVYERLAREGSLDDICHID